MDWMTGLQRAIDYVEAHLADDIDYAAAAKEAVSSSFHFQRVFSIICGYTLGDYIRMRRLSLAVDELMRTNEKVIDIALKYGYDTPESFSRAFARFHGVPPTQARSGSAVRSFSRLSVKLILDGGNLMNYRIEKRDAFKVICKKKQVNKPQDDTATADISAFWQELSTDGSMEIISKYASCEKLHGVLGICFSNEMANSGFPYGIGAEYNGAPVTEEGFDIVEIPAHTYAVLNARARCPRHSRRPIRRSAPNSSRKAAHINTATALSWRSIPQRM